MSRIPVHLEHGHYILNIDSTRIVAVSRETASAATAWTIQDGMAHAAWIGGRIPTQALLSLRRAGAVWQTELWDKT